MLVRVRRFLLRLLGPLVERQTNYNAMNVALAEYLVHAVDRLQGELIQQAEALHGVHSALPAQSLDLDYSSLMERFRGGEAEIADRQRVYVDLFREAEPVLDLGCGRGEFLELLGEAGIPARGIDTDAAMVARCQAKNLDAVAIDATEYLASARDGSLGGVFAAQVVEHMSAAQVVELVRSCRKKLRPGGVLLLETPNPATLLVLSTFQLDFTHVRCYHPDSLKWLFENAGFEDVRLQFSAPADETLRLPPLPAGKEDPALDEFNRGLERLNWILFGFQDYAVIGRVPAGTE